MRNHCTLTEPRRQRAFERALDSAATSPYARHVTSWILAGIGNGARVAAAVGTRCRGNIAGYALLSYPLNEAMPASKGPGHPDSRPPLLKARAPLLFVHTPAQEACPLADLRAFCSTVRTPAALLLPARALCAALCCAVSAVLCAVLQCARKQVLLVLQKEGHWRCVGLCGCTSFGVGCPILSAT